MEQVVLLRDVVSSDLPLLLEWRNCADFIRFVTHRKYRVTADEFAEELANDFASDREAQYMCLAPSGVAIGTAIAYRCTTEQKLFCSLYIGHAYRRQMLGRQAIGAVAIRLLGDFAGETIHFHVYRDNLIVVDALHRFGLPESACQNREDLLLFNVSPADVARAVTG